MSHEGTIPLTDSAELSRTLASQPWDIIKAIQTIQAHCVCIVDENPGERVLDLVGCISINCKELADALHQQQPQPSKEGK